MKVAVIGLGHVGIPIASSLAAAGHDVVGIDIDERKVEQVNAGRNPLPTREEELDSLVSKVVSAGSLRATGSHETCEDADCIIVCVDTPVNTANREADYTALTSAIKSLAPHMRRGCLVSVESTLAPGTMRSLVSPTLQEGSGLRVHQDFHLVHCPERVTPGRLLHNLTTLDRIVGGETEESRQMAISLYRDVCRGQFHETNWVNAELCKTVENAYRDVQLAFANEVALLCERAGGDVFTVRELVNTCPGRDMLLPGPGVGGHCLNKDSWLLVSVWREAARLIPAAREVNEAMPEHVVSLVKRALEAAGVDVHRSRIAILGAAYRENIPETSNSPGLRIYEQLRGLGADTRLHDPHVGQLPGVDLRGAITDVASEADCMVLVTPHDAFGDVDWASVGATMRNRIVVDCRGFLNTEEMAQAGFHYVGLGRTANQDSSTG